MLTECATIMHSIFSNAGLTNKLKKIYIVWVGHIFRTLALGKLNKTHCELFGGESSINHSFVHSLQCFKLWRCDEHDIWHELCSF